MSLRVLILWVATLCALVFQLSIASDQCGYNKFAVTGSNLNPDDTSTTNNNARCQNYGGGTWCCYCPSGSYAPSGSNINSEADCVKCPKGSFLSDALLTSSNGQCVLCPAGMYQPSNGQSSCLHCPPGQTTFVQNNLQGPSTNQQIGAIGVESCTPTPGGYLTKGYSQYTSIYDANGANTGGTSTVTYLSACNTFGKILPASAIPVNGLNSESQCDFCAPPTAFFVAGGYTSINVLNICPPSSSCFSQYVYGQETYLQNKPGSDGLSTSTREYRHAASATCTAACPQGTGQSTVGDVKVCATCKKALGLYSDGHGTCLRCDRFSYPKSDGGAECSSCQPFFPYTSRWNAQAESATPPTDQWALQNFADNMLQYHSCADHATVETSLCLCLQPFPVLVICGVISLFFSVNLLVFVCCTIGRQQRHQLDKPEKGKKQIKKQHEAAETEKQLLATQAILDKAEPLSPSKAGLTSPSKSGMQSPTQEQQPVDEVTLASESQEQESVASVSSEDVAKTSMGTWTPVKEEDVLPEPTKPVLVGWRVMIGLLAYILIPFVDNLTDVAFLLSNPFFNVQLFVAFIVFLCLPGLFFFKTLLDKKAVPRFYLVPMPQYLLFQRYDSLYKSVIGLLLLIPYLLLNAPVLLPWLIIGSLLYQSKAFAVRPVANLWLHVWTGDFFAQPSTINPAMQKAHERRLKDMEQADFHPIDEKVLNEAINSHVALETGPLVVVQFINNSLSNSWTPLAIFSMAFSIFNAISGVYRIVYYKVISGIPMTDIPVDFSILGVSMFGRETQKKLLGEAGGKGHEAHRLSLFRTDSGMHTGVIDNWVDKDGRVHSDTPGQPVLAHVCEDVVVLRGRVEALEAKLQAVLAQLATGSSSSSS